ncbi:hypothetical protein PROFUN_10780 [Planoprotostelium fungivorum]|uniref:Uncharacterized protein n=1 Tax=Planoprotostelium fungivorum TaxID=1890364 RepID=A0A2P6NCX1_9EUKA|nr:hypothetical protein PROFUN_10780 [Planoprotostelium fungivorum]
MSAHDGTVKPRVNRVAERRSESLLELNCIVLFSGDPYPTLLCTGSRGCSVFKLRSRTCFWRQKKEMSILLLILCRQTGRSSSRADYQASITFERVDMLVKSIVAVNKICNEHLKQIESYVQRHLIFQVLHAGPESLTGMRDKGLRVLNQNSARTICIVFVNRDIYRWNQRSLLSQKQGGCQAIDDSLPRSYVPLRVGTEKTDLAPSLNEIRPRRSLLSQKQVEKHMGYPKMVRISGVISHLWRVPGGVFHRCSVSTLKVVEKSLLA